LRFSAFFLGQNLEFWIKILFFKISKLCNKEGKVHIMINRPPPRVENGAPLATPVRATAPPRDERNHDNPSGRHFWTKNRTECLLNLLADQAQTNGDVSLSLSALTPFFRIS